VTAALHEQAFLRMMKNANTKAAFNDHVEEKSKPLPSSKAAAMIEQPAKSTKKPTTGTQKPASVLAKSAETPAVAFREIEARSANESPNAAGNIRLAPTHELAFPPPITTSGRKNIHGSSVSVHTDGVESATTFDSADFATQSSGGAHSKLDLDHGTIIIGSRSREENSPAKAEANSGDSLGIRVLPPANHAEFAQRDDLITLDEGSNVSEAVAEASNDGALGDSNADSVQSSGIRDIMDEKLDTDVPQIPLTPKSSLAPRFITYRGCRYIRADQVTSQDIEDDLQVTLPARRMVPPDIGGFDRLALTGGLRIGLQTLHDNSGGSILGEHNLPGRSRGSTEASSNLALGVSGRIAPSSEVNAGLRTSQESASINILGEHNLPGHSRSSTESSALSLAASSRATRNVRPAAPRANIRRPSTSWASASLTAFQLYSEHEPARSEIHEPPKAFQQSSEHDRSSQTAQKSDAEMTDISATSFAQNKALTSNLSASKYAIPGASVVASRVNQVQSATFTESAGPSLTGHTQVTEALATPSVRHNVAPASSLAASKWATPAAEIITSRVQGNPAKSGVLDPHHVNNIL
jgi:hypothetical protein